jgi:hypothetical protein
MVWPQAINGLLTMDSNTMHPSTGVENYFARSLGFALLALALTTVVMTGAFPLASSTDSKHILHLLALLGGSNSEQDKRTASLPMPVRFSYLPRSTMAP